MPSLPSSLALTNIADGSLIVAADHRNNYVAIQTAVNALIAALSGGSAGQILEALSSSSVGFFNAPGTELGSSQITTDTTTTSAVLADLTTIATSVTFENVKYYVEIAIPLLRHSVAGTATSFALNVDGSTVGNTAQADNPGGSNGSAYFLRIPWTPSAGTHTVKIQWSTASGTATIRATGLAAAHFRIVKA